MQTSKQKGINILVLDCIFAILTGCVFAVILVISININRRFHAVKNAIDKFIICEQSSMTIKERANYLTERARCFVATHNEKYVQEYLTELEEEKGREKALHALEEVCSEEDLALQRLNIAMRQAESLSNLELYTMRIAYEVMGTPDIPERIRKIELSSVDRQFSIQKLQELAITNLFGEGYLLYKRRINENCNLTVASIEKQIKDELNMNANQLGTNLAHLRLLLLLLLLIAVALFITFDFLVVLPLKRFLRSIKNDEKLSIIGSAEFKNLAASYNEIYELKAQQQRKLLRNAEYDSLTGILNRRAFDQLCQSSTERSTPIALILIDMDNFKHINDTFGHAGGDHALKELARLLTETFREGDFIARIGGDEFATIMPDCHPSAAGQIRKKLSMVNNALRTLPGGIQPLSISAGAAFSETGFSETLYQQADQALYNVKASGKRGCKIFGE